jgi:hypothetical protein
LGFLGQLTDNRISRLESRLAATTGGPTLVLVDTIFPMLHLNFLDELKRKVPNK